MKNSYLLVLFILSILSLKAQVVGGSEEKLAKLYSSGNFELCLYKAGDLTYKSSYKKNPEPYLYIALCYYELSISEDEYLREEFKKGFRNSLKITAKFVKMDKEGVMYDDNIEFIQLLKDKQFAIIKDYFDKGDYKKAASSSKYYGRLNREKDYSIIYFQGVSEVLSNNYSTGTRNVEKASLELNVLLNDENFKFDKLFEPLVLISFQKYSDYLTNDDLRDLALDNLTLAKKIYPSDIFLVKQYDKILQENKLIQDSIQYIMEQKLIQDSIQNITN